VAGRGARDGLINHPKEAHIQEMRPEKGQLDAFAVLLQEIGARLPADRDPPTLGAAADSDYDSALRAFDQIMQARGVPIGNLPPDARCEIVRLIAEIGDRHRRRRGDEPAPLTHYQAELVAIAEAKIERLCRDWESRRNGIEAEATGCSRSGSRRIANMPRSNASMPRRGTASRTHCCRYGSTSRFCLVWASRNTG
jgi:hypothetical protein